MNDGGALSGSSTEWAAVFAAVGGAGLIARFWDEIFGRRKRGIDEKVAIQQMLDGTTRMILEQDQARMSQMSEALTALTSRVDELATKNVEALSEINLLRQAVELLVKHISALEVLLRSKNVNPPPRPAMPTAE